MTHDERIAVLVCTLNRPECLRRLMQSIGRVAVPSSLRVRVVIVDNDADGNAHSIASEPLPEPWTVSYVHEPTHGLATVRNRALQECGTGEHAVFIDDDQTVRTTWLSEMWVAHAKWPEAMLSGNVAYSGPAGQRMARRLPPMGAPMPYTGTGNLFIPAQVLTQHRLEFDLSFDQTGGEDTAFTMSAVSAGVAIRAVPTAVCDEYWHADRWTPSAHWHRARTSSANFVRITGRGPRKAVRRLFGALVSAMTGLARLVWGLLARDEEVTCKAMSDLGSSAGTVDGILGKTPSRR